ncbi:MAG: SDR family NAD(P)-dependent oxidoreductase, partial [Candidatus Uhrbacteria bacterium]
MRLKNKVALVTGAALGYKSGGPSIGGAIACKLASEGAQVVVVDVLEEMGKRTAETIVSQGGRAVFVRADTTQAADVQEAVAKAEEHFGGLHCLVNCAASYEGDIVHSIVDTPEEDWMRIFDVNLHGYFRCAKYAIPLMLKSGGGTIVNV